MLLPLIARHGRACRTSVVPRGYRSRAGRVAGAARARQHSGASARAGRIAAAVSANGADRFRDGSARSSVGRKPSKRSSAAGCWRSSALRRRARSRAGAPRRTSSGDCTMACDWSRPRTARWSRHRGIRNRSCCRIIVELQRRGEFRVRGRNTDLIEVAGKRASLADLTRRVLAIQGVRDAVVFQPSAGFGRDDSSRRRARRRARSDRGTDSRTTGGEHRPCFPAAPIGSRRSLAAQRARQAAARRVAICTHRRDASKPMRYTGRRFHGRLSRAETSTRTRWNPCHSISGAL